MDLRWRYHDLANTANASSLSKELNIRPELSSLLIQRGIDTFDTAKDFFRPTLDRLHDPFLMKDLHEAVDRLGEAIFQKEKILVYGDYDVDGTTSVALVYSFLHEIKDPETVIEYYIPDRHKEGYGISKQGIEYAHQNEFSLIVALDCGIKAHDQALLAKSYGIDLIICDHHIPGESLPEAFAILDPKRSDCQYPFKELSGCGVGFKLLQGFCIQNTIEPTKLFRYLDFLVISIASDIVPIVGENRILAFYGLKKINSDPLDSIQSLIEVSGLKSSLKVSDLVFYLGPRINAAGRLSHAKKAVELLVGEDSKILEAVSKELNAINTARREADLATTEEALEMIFENEGFEKLNSTVVYNQNWHKGIVGIVASRCIEKHYRPTIVLTSSGGKVTGSARSVEGFDVYDAIENCSDLLSQFGGHHHAAGLTLPVENVDAFRERFEEVVSEKILPEQLEPKLDIDLDVPLSFVSFKVMSIINQMAPFGPGNLNPVFSTKSVSLYGEIKVLAEKHLKFTVQQDGSKVEAIGFNMIEFKEKLTSAKKFHVAYHMEENEFRGHKSLQIVLKDIKFDQ